MWDLALLAGFLTPVASSLVALATLGIAFSGLPQPPSSLFNSPLPVLLVVVVGMAVAFLEPGSISVDCRLFGRREIIIPSIRPPKS